MHMIDVACRPEWRYRTECRGWLTLHFLPTSVTRSDSVVVGRSSQSAAARQDCARISQQCIHELDAAFRPGVLDTGIKHRRTNDKQATAKAHQRRNTHIKPPATWLEVTQISASKRHWDARPAPNRTGARADHSQSERDQPPWRI